MSGLCACGCGKPTPIAPQTHRRKGWIKGEPLKFIRGHSRRRPVIEHAVRDPETGCLIWAGGVNSEAGYGKVMRGGKRMGAHRLSYIEAYGPIPPGMLVLHSCDRPKCIEPTHLRLGTHADNARDVIARGRSSLPSHRGAEINTAKLTEDDVRAIRASTDSQNVLAARYGVRQGTISVIRRRKSWAHIE